MKITLAMILLFTMKSMAFSLGDDTFKWDKSSLTVCWGKIDVLDGIFRNPVKNLAPEHVTYLEENDKLAIQKKIQQEFKLNKVGIEFVGWQNCSPDKKYDIALVGIDRIDPLHIKPTIPAGQATVGMATLTDLITYKKEKRSEGQPGFVLLVKTPRAGDNHKLMIDLTDKLLFTALHEFGHAAGLRHEHAQAQGLNDENCKLTYGKTILSDIRETNKGAHVYGSYDPRSIMNYCYIHIINYIKPITAREVKFTSGDIHTLRCLYLADQEPAGSCEAREIPKPQLNNL